MSFVSDYDRLKKRYDAVVLEWTSAKAVLEMQSKKAAQAETELLSVTKAKSVADVPGLLDKLSKTIETKLGLLQEKIEQLESAVVAVKSSGVATSDVVEEF